MDKSLSIIVAAFAIIDLSLMALLAISPLVAWVAHVVLSVIFFAVLFVKTQVKSFQGIGTFVFLGMLLSLLAPFVGLLAIGALVSKLNDKAASGDTKDRYIVGNKMRENECLEPVSVNQSPEPMVTLLGQEKFDELADGIGFIKGDYTGETITLLKRIRDRSSALASLHASAALSVLSDHNEAVLSGCESAQKKFGDTVEGCYQLGSAYRMKANSGSVPADEKISFLKQAVEQFAKNPDDLPSLISGIECAIELEDYGMAEDWLLKMKSITGAQRHYDQLRMRLLAHAGEWQALRDSLLSQPFDGSNAVNNFWRASV